MPERSTGERAGKVKWVDILVVDQDNAEAYTGRRRFLSHIGRRFACFVRWRRRFIADRSGNADADVDADATGRCRMHQLFTSYGFDESLSGKERRRCNQSESAVCHLSGFGCGSCTAEHR